MQLSCVLDYATGGVDQFTCTDPPLIRITPLDLCNTYVPSTMTLPALVSSLTAAQRDFFLGIDHEAPPVGFSSCTCAGRSWSLHAAIDGRRPRTMGARGRPLRTAGQHHRRCHLP